MFGKKKVLLVEDDKKISSFITVILEGDDYQVFSTDKGKSAISLTASHSPDLILLDLGLNDMDGMEVLEKLREWTSIPIIIVSAREKEEDKVEALDKGANDYITKPFGNNELLARIRTALRLYDSGKVAKTETQYKNGDLVIDYEKRLVKMDGKSIHLTPLEYKILMHLAQNEGKVLTHEYLIQNLWGSYMYDSQLLRVNIANIRRKIEKNPADPKYILTEVGVGYRFVNVDEEN